MSLVMVLIASLIGSPHCAAMCGGFVAVCSHGEKPFLRQSAYHIGRLLTYILLGIAAGYVGEKVNEVGQAFGVQTLAGYITGGLLIGAGLMQLLAWRRSEAQGTGNATLVQIQKRILPDSSKTFMYPLSIGLFSTFLPCGWLYTYVVVAAGTGSTLDSVLTMIFFWLGTLPVLVTVGSLAHLFVSPLARVLPLVASLMMIVAGFYSIYIHYQHAHHNHAHHGHHDHEAMHHHGG